MTWEDQFSRWAEAAERDALDDKTERLIVIETRKAARGRGELDNPTGWQWVRAAVGDPDRRRFVADVFNKQSIPKKLAHLMLEMGVNEPNPSGNRYFIEPAVKALGATYVLRRLKTHLEDGIGFEKAGAASAAYWVRGDAADVDYQRANAEFRDELLRQFIANEDIEVRRRILPGLSMRASDYSTDVGRLIPDAIQIARNHQDPYIKHRIEIQLGADGLRGGFTSLTR